MVQREDFCHICELPINLMIYSGSIEIEGIKKRHPLALHIDHIVPRSLGGDDSFENLAPSHAYCNMSKSNNFSGSGSEAFRQEKKRIILKMSKFPVQQLWTEFTFCSKHPDKRTSVVGEGNDSEIRGFCQICYKKEKRGTCESCNKTTAYMHSRVKCDSCYSKEIEGNCLGCGKTEGNFKSKTKCYTCHAKGLRGQCKICNRTSEEAVMKTKSKCKSCYGKELRLKQSTGFCLRCNKYCASVVSEGIVCNSCFLESKTKSCSVCGVSNQDIDFTTKKMCKLCHQRRKRSKSYPKTECRGCGAYGHPAVNRHKLCEKCHLSGGFIPSCQECGVRRSETVKFSSLDFCSKCYYRNTEKRDKENMQIE